MNALTRSGPLRRCFATSAAATAVPKAGAMKQHVEIAVGNSIAKIAPSKARLARTGQKKVYEYTLYASLIHGSPGAIKQVKFFPDIIDDTYLPKSYTKTEGPPFQTSHDCWDVSTARLEILMNDGTIKTINKRIKKTANNEAKFRLVYKPYPVVTKRAFGVELEFLTRTKPGAVRDSIKRVTDQESFVTGYSKKSMKAWKVETDNTIESPGDGWYAVEVVSPILRSEGGVDFIKKVAQELAKQGATANSSCGLHVHIDLQGVNLETLKKICQNWIKYEDAIDLLLPADRRESKNKYCLNVRSNMKLGKLSNRQAHDLIGSQTTLGGLARVMNGHPEARNRYFKLNLQNLVSKDNPRNTVEFRGHPGTVDAAEIENWVRFLNAFVAASIAKSKAPMLPFKDSKTKQQKKKKLYAFLKNYL